MSTTTSPTIILGTANIGAPTDPQAKYSTPELAQSFLDLFKSYGFTTIDTARAYSPGAPGTSEVLLGQTDFATWATLDTKVKSFAPGSHSASSIAESIDASLAALKVSKVRIMYLHAPERTTPFAETCEAMNAAHRAGKFEEFGLSNYAPAEVEEIVSICKDKGFVQPTVYQGQYNAICRSGEEEEAGNLFGVLRKHGMRFFAYTPSAAGFFSNKVNKDSINTPGSRWDKDTRIGQMYGGLYMKEELLSAAERVRSAAQKEGISGHAVALRWVLHHSTLDGSKGDAVILGASSEAQLEENLKICKEGPLPEGLVKIVDDVWGPAKPFAPSAHF